MTTLRRALYSIALLGALSLLVWGYHQRSKAEQGRTALAEQRLATVTERSQRQAATIVRMGGELADQQLAQQSQLTTINNLRLAAATDHLKKQEIRSDDPQFHDWGAQPLPDAARRMHQRPAFTGADGYRQWLPSRHTLHAQPGNADQQ
ncbi:DUF2570 domain-containing protein [Pseudomonas taiwanensis]|uniref:DUF2570 domain-containing protein n=1 Tax=Pseudomonas taiwanensis TaxID=470150 RepID=UPI001647807F|nr:DUF2570 domain-containing protein [Pseudomonas taiwanensis]MBC3489908.1 DUF2570 domain-containing protein [Pseudomonas taiwanensis]